MLVNLPIEHLQADVRALALSSKLQLQSCHGVTA